MIKKYAFILFSAFIVANVAGDAFAADVNDLQEARGVPTRLQIMAALDYRDRMNEAFCDPEMEDPARAAWLGGKPAFYDGVDACVSHFSAMDQMDGAPAYLASAMTQQDQNIGEAEHEDQMDAFANARPPYPYYDLVAEVWEGREAARQAAIEAAFVAPDDAYAAAQGANM